MAITQQIFAVACFPFFLMGYGFLWTVQAINIDGNAMIDGWDLYCLVQWVKERKPNIVSSSYHHYCAESISALKSGIFLVLYFLYPWRKWKFVFCFVYVHRSASNCISLSWFFFLFTVSIVKPAEVCVRVTHKQEHISSRWKFYVDILFLCLSATNSDNYTSHMWLNLSWCVSQRYWWMTTVSKWCVRVYTNGFPFHNTYYIYFVVHASAWYSSFFSYCPKMSLIMKLVTMDCLLVCLFASSPL